MTSISIATEPSNSKTPHVNNFDLTAYKVLYIQGLKMPYQEGFRFAESNKREILSQHFDVIAPDLPVNPHDAMCTLEPIAQLHSPRLALVGNSIGAFYAAFLASKYNLPLVVINPVVKPYDFKDISKIVPPENLESVKSYLRSLELPINPNKTFAIMHRNDEVLGYGDAWNEYKDCTYTVMNQGEHHDLVSFKYWLPLFNWFFASVFEGAK